MSAAHSTAGLWMLLALAALVLITELPVWALLIGSASLFAGGGLVLGVFDLHVLAAISGRTLGLLEHDLLQALPLYVFVGVLLQRLTVADALFATLRWLFQRSGAGTSLAAFGVGSLVAPMNGSVASSSAMMTRLVAPKLGQLDAAAATALISTSSTIGVVVPPSLVLILLGDAMLRAHTEASNLSAYTSGNQQIINTQNVFHSALLPAAVVLALWLLVAWWRGRRLEPSARTVAVTRAEGFVSVLVIAGVTTLLAGVFSGRIFAVEAAATGALVLVIATLLTRSLSWSLWRDVLADTLSLSGALLALLVGATTFSLVFRLWGTDAWMTETILSSTLSSGATAALVLALVALCAWVLDAFEMIFVIIPVVAPPLICLLGDAQQTAVLLLLVLQLSFLVPPMGYAIMMARSRMKGPAVALPSILHALLPFLTAQCLVTLFVFFNPWTVHQLDRTTPPSDEPALSAQDLDQQMRDMADLATKTDQKP